ncbi:MAG: hypothetical protein GY711_28795 [bacterium]|nr:hypothetical protein [bacterium]
MVLADDAVDAVGGHDQVRLELTLVGDLGLEPELDAELPRTCLEDLEELLAGEPEKPCPVERTQAPPK